MADRDEDSGDDDVIHCLLCYKPQNDLAAHLAETCMKNNTAEERQAEGQRAEESMDKWIWSGRNWDYNEICSMMPDEPSRQTCLEQLLRRGYFVANVPNDKDLAVDQKQPLAVAVESPPQASGSETPNLGSACQTPRDPTCQHPSA